MHCSCCNSSRSTCTRNCGTDIKSRNESITFTIRKKDWSQNWFTCSPLLSLFIFSFLSISSLLFPAFMLPLHIFLSPSVSSTCPVHTPPLFSVLFTSTHLTSAVLVYLIYENSHPFMQSFHFFFFPPHPPL